MKSGDVAELKPYHQECNGCAYANQYITRTVFSPKSGWDMINEEKRCEETDCRSHPLYDLVRGKKQGKQS